jgi:ABC-type multidrug transport system fused ATPase/permease subunit
MSLFIYDKLILQYLKENKYLLIKYLCTVFVLYFFESIALSRTNAQLFSSLYNKHSQVLTKNESFKYVIHIGIIFTIIVFCYYLLKKIEVNLYPNYSAFIRKNIFENTIKKFSNNLTDIKIGKYISRIIDLTKELNKLLQIVITECITKFFIIFFIIIYFLFLNYKIGIVFLVEVIFIFLIIKYYQPKIIELATKKCELFFDLNESNSDSLTNLANIYLNNEIKNEINNNSTLSEEYKDYSKKAYEYSNGMINLINIVILITFFTIFFYTYYLFIHKEIDKMVIINIYILLFFFCGTSIRIISNIGELFHFYGYVVASNKFVEYIYDNDESKNIKRVDIKSGHIQMKNIVFFYKNNKVIFKNLNLQIEGNKKTVVLGKSGSGKSTISKLIVKLYNPQKGDIYIDNVNIKNIDTKYLRDKVIYINQKTILFNKSIMDNILYGNDHLNDKQVINIMKKYQLYSLFNNMKDGLYSSCGVNGNNLSLGMQKIVILLRGVLKNNYKIIIYDEPLAGLDKNSRKKVITMINDLSVDKTVLIITHDNEILDIADNVIEMNKIL